MRLHSVRMRVLASIAIFIFQEALGHNLPLHCTKWKEHCSKYRKKCSEVVEKSCCDHLPQDSDNKSNAESGLYTVHSGRFSKSDAWCDMETDGGGWTVIMRRESNEISFDKIYSEYEEGFGELSGNFWYGLRAMEAMTRVGDHEMQLDMYTDVNDTVSSASAHYDHFKVVGGVDYTLMLSNYTGSDSNLRDNMMQFNNKSFVAKRTVIDASFSCVNVIKGGWWYAEHCVSGGNETQGTVLSRHYSDLDWYDLSIKDYPNARKFAKYEMKIRSKDCIATI